MSLRCPLAIPICTWSSHRLSPGSLLTVQDLAAFQPKVVAPLEMALGNYTLYSPPPPAGGAILNFILQVLQGKPFIRSPLCPPDTVTKGWMRLLLKKSLALGVELKGRGFPKLGPHHISPLVSGPLPNSKLPVTVLLGLIRSSFLKVQPPPNADTMVIKAPIPVDSQRHPRHTPIIANGPCPF